ncbi:hypothetical protein [Vermiculatibacterium agrestimuris]|uniref:hypothetical protein n=1 Tax=Vermiculatibacterium agrestimuris TaxID=2941519 RepID=UPI00203C8DC0|nr:hypothetical protein [Vermiculatibacterium agrestimuris]
MIANIWNTLCNLDVNTMGCITAAGAFVLSLLCFFEAYMEHKKQKQGKQTETFAPHIFISIAILFGVASIVSFFAGIILSWLV